MQSIFPAPGRALALALLVLAAGCATEETPASIVDLAMAPVGATDAAVDLAPADPCRACGGDTPVCDKAGRRCVGCLVDGDCARSFVCAMNRCLPGCSAVRPDCGDLGVCEADAGVCRECSRDADCHDPARPVCDAAAGSCAACRIADDRCPPGTWCAQQGGAVACVAGCKSDAECRAGDGGGAGRACCDHACVDTSSSTSNCGACGAACAMGACCGGRCSDTMSDAANCGACGKPCQFANAMGVCAGGACMIGACAMGYASCDGDPANGCEVSIGSDPANCGACNKVCAAAHASVGCIAGACAIFACDQTHRDCNNAYGDGCETDIANDSANCGGCKNSCAVLPHASAGCVASKCAIGACDMGFANCDGNDANGCESKLDADPANCGGCGKACPAPPNVVAVCAASQCSLAGCGAGFSDCDNNMGNGCEAKLAADPKNCGACGVVCAGGPNAAAACVNSKCALACNPGFGDCDNNPVNGCELSLLADNGNCGACNIACQQGGQCMGGKCQMCGSSPGSALPSCLDLKQKCQVPTGVYWIQPPNVANAYQAHCDMTLDGGGWTAFFAGINGSPHVFAHFEDVAVNCADPAAQCLRRLPPGATTNNEFLATCGAFAVKFKITQASLGYLRDGVQGPFWQNNANVASVAGNVNPANADQFWSGQGGNKGWIVGDIAGGGRTFSSSYDLNAGWDYCNGVGNTTSPIKLLYR